MTDNTKGRSAEDRAEKMIAAFCENPQPGLDGMIRWRIKMGEIFVAQIRESETQAFERGRKEAHDWWAKNSELAINQTYKDAFLACREKAATVADDHPHCQEGCGCSGAIAFKIEQLTPDGGSEA